ncbi:c-type cytochrome [Phaeobacter sp. PT47_59]|uniref:c-type cytochrome n=1 Tax=Phaeobacter sp. PT47_59 TaxID=3029979 RepID=UPI002380BBA4|nr:c-type cytochrome [Phaeobacter sp. PT47_59]MDE4176670.1 c-type cytochrome [Phaeobacter sp. PT47_59]
MKRKYYLLGVPVVVAVAASFQLGSAPEPATQAPAVGAPIVTVQVPPLQGNAVIGQQIFAKRCSACHGENAAGKEGAGPPLIHVIYEPNHHADEAFQRAVAMGVRSHHWRFGDMPPVEGLTRGDVAMVTAYIRDVQRANGIQ